MNKPTDSLDFTTLSGIDRRTINGALSGAGNTTMLSRIGAPRGSYDAECRPVENPQIAAMIETADFGPFRATGLRPAIRVLTAIMADIRSEQRAIHDSMTTAGMLCCRLVRGSATAISNHSWGTAIDLKIEGILDPRGDGHTLRALLDIHPIFNRHGFFWGAAFPTEDAMHFEASEQLIRKWADDGAFGALSHAIPTAMTIGDRGVHVEQVQLALNRALAPIAIAADGVFGKDTRAALIEFQRRNGLPLSGTGSARVQALLKQA